MTNNSFFGNVTNATRLFDVPLWIANTTVIGFLGLVSFYVIAALAIYEVKTQGMKHPGRSQRETSFTKTSKLLCISIGVMCLLYQLFSLWTLSLEYGASQNRTRAFSNRRSEILCQILPRLEIFTVIIGTALVYLFLWFRQRVFYINPSLSSLNSKTVKSVSYLVLSAWIIYFVPTVVVYCIIIRYKFAQPGGCLIMTSSLRKYKFIIISWVIVSILMQIALLCLFIKPILNRTSIKKSKSSKFSAASSSHKRLILRVQRAVAFTIICLVSDSLACAITVATFRTNVNNSVMIYNINLMVNFLATIFCFDHWHKMLWPWTTSANDFRNFQSTSARPTTTPTGNAKISSVECKESSPSVIEKKSNAD